MNKLTQALMEELTVEYVKVGPLQIPESVVISWVIMVLVVLGSILLTRNLKVDHISKRQAVLEMAYTAGKNFFEGLLGKEGACYVPYLMTVAIYIACSNLIGVFGVKPPTKDLDVTAALALMSIVLIEGSGIRARGGVGFLKSLAAPTPVMTPMNILEIAIRPTSLCMRLFGNVLGAFVIMELIKLVVPVFVPVARQFFCETRTEFLRKNSPVLRSKSETRSLASTAPKMEGAVHVKGRVLAWGGAAFAAPPLAFCPWGSSYPSVASPASSAASWAATGSVYSDQP